MKRFLRYIVLLFVLFSGLTIFVNAASTDVTMIVVNPGADMSKEVNISWHATTDGTIVKYTLASDSSYTNQQFMISECRPIPFEGKGNVQQCKATLSNLAPDTRYRFQIGKGNSWSDDYQFKTAGTGTFSFVHITDIHSYTPIPTRVSTANEVINKAKTLVSDLEFILFSGDVTAYGTVYDQWENLYKMDTAKEMMYAITPGNHDYYNSSAQTTNISYFNAMTNNPDNGAEEVKGSSYYFKYGNALFISVDSEAAYHDQNKYLPNLKKWVGEVIEANPSEYIIMFCHKPFYTGNGGSGTLTKFMRQHFGPLCDKYGIDLVLTGDNHILARSHSLINGQKTNNPAHGTVYMVGPQIGDRYVEAGTPPAEIAFTQGGKVDGATIVTVGNGKISLKIYDKSGNILDTYDIIAKSSTISKSATLNEMSIELDEEDISQGTLRIKDNGLGRTRKVRVLKDNQEIAAFSYPENVNLPLTGLPDAGTPYSLQIEITLRNGEKIGKTLTPQIPAGYYGKIKNLHVADIDDKSLGLFWDNALIPGKVKSLELYINGEHKESIDPEEDMIPLDRVSPYHKNVIKLQALNQDDEIVLEEEITFGEEADPVEIAFTETNKTIYVGNQYTPTVTADPEQELDFEYTSSNPTVATVDENGVITAVGPGECVITVNVVKRWDVAATLTVTVEQISLSFVNESISMKAGAKTTPAYSINPSVELDLVFTSSDENVATVDENGEITAVAPGTCTITVHAANNPDVSAEITVTVKKKGCFASTGAMFGFAGIGLAMIIFKRRKKNEITA